MPGGGGFKVVGGAADFEKLAAKLKAAERRALRRHITQGLRDIAKPVGQAMVTRGAAEMPSGGGLAARVAAARIIQRNYLGRDPRVVLTFRTREGYDLGSLERGEVRHPTFGRAPWVSQPVPPGAYSRAMEAELPKVHDALARELEKVIREIGD